MEETYTGIRPKDFYKSDNTSSMIQLWAGQQHRNSFLNRILALLAKDSILAQAIQFQLIQNVTEVIPEMETSVQKMNIIKRSFGMKLAVHWSKYSSGTLMLDLQHQKP